MKTLLLIVVVGSWFISAQLWADSRQPNFLIFISDDLTYRDIGVYGNPDVKTPNLDNFARQGLKFNLAFSSSSMCAPTRMSLYTGLQPVRSGAHPNHGQVYEGTRSLPNYLRPLGYRVGLMGKRHEAPHASFSFEYLGGKHGDTQRNKADLNLNLAERFFKQTEQPWALVVATNQPHTPWFRGDKSTYSPKHLTVPDDLVDTPETRRALSAYYAEITYMDQQFGTIMKMLEKSGEADNTLVIYLSEQGSNFPFAKWTLYESGHRAAALMRWPNKIKPARETDAIVQYSDILPTLIEAAGGELKNIPLDGKSLLDILLHNKQTHRKFAYAIQTTKGIYSGSDSYPIRSIRSDRYRLIWNLNHNHAFSNTVVTQGGPSGTLSSWRKHGDTELARANAYSQRPEFELYDLAQDPYELNNLAGNKKVAKVQRTLFNELKAWMEQQGDLGIATEADALNRKNLAGRHYLKGIPKGGLALDWVYSH
ncbi:sulfatase atsG [Catenovulum agarivorans DS-2]|uniref:Sulfatase atsG n=1 Tax=Catenovulum agarivorans DS-2 TaxID=1328313 RepID=W7QLI9_9ALTE|nr:sulfatase [Catenovulum agarivorans]EWH09802.1 sulfatase atsG [Catenovulum agarivorans DS-2]